MRYTTAWMNKYRIHSRHGSGRDLSLTIFYLIEVFLKHINWYWKYNSRILLCTNATQGLKIIINNIVFAFSTLLEMFKDIQETSETLLICRTCKYLSCKAAELSDITSLASFRAWLAFCSPWAAITCGVNVIIEMFSSQKCHHRDVFIIEMSS